MTLTQLEYILAVEKHLNFNSAADACHVAQPSLSAQIKKLEEELNVVLFQRSAHTGVSITEVGYSILQQARIILNEVQKLKDISADRNNEVTGLIKVGIIPTVGPFLIPHFISAFKKNHPHIQIEFLEESTQILIDELHHGRIDCAILSPPDKAPSQLIEKVMFYEPFLVYGNKNHPLLKSNPVKLASLSQYSVSLLDETHCMRDQVMSACQTKKSIQPELSLKQGSLQTLISIVESQNSYTLVPQLSIDVLNLKFKKEGVRQIISQTPYRKISLIYNKNLVRKKLVDLLFDCIQSQLPDSVALKAHAKSFVIEPSKSHFKRD